MPDKSQKSEKPTAKHRREARTDGRVARTPEIGSWLSLVALVLVLPALGGRAITVVTSFMAVASGAMSSGDPTQSLALLGRGLGTVVDAAGPLLLVATAAAVAAGFGQVGVRFAPGALGLKWTRVSPTTGLKRIFSVTGAWELTKMVVRLLILIGIGFLVDRHLVSDLLGPGTLPLQGTLDTTSGTLIDLIRDIAATALVLAFVDYAFQRRRFNDSLKMTKEEVRREHRENEGNPDVRRALRRRRRRLSRLQLYAAVAQADVVVVNPTHFSVGLRFDRAKDAAPRVVAKGEDDDAFVIREAARDHGVPIVENPPVARSLYDACEVGDLVPSNLYKVVARLLAFVYRLSPAARALVDTHKMVA
jgi:flagellar biosynthetic protein FlhB